MSLNLKQQTFPASERARLIKLIHIAKKQLGVGEEDYRALLSSLTGQESCKEMDACQLNAVYHWFIDHGFKPGPGANGQGSKSPMSRHLPAEKKQPRHRAVAAWIELYRLGIVRDGSHEALRTFVRNKLEKRMRILPGVDPLAACTHKQMAEVIQALETWRDKELEKRHANH
jgi:phage gp16-like protein